MLSTPPSANTEPLGWEDSLLVTRFSSRQPCGSWTGWSLRVPSSSPCSVVPWVPLAADVGWARMRGQLGPRAVLLGFEICYH